MRFFLFPNKGKVSRSMACQICDQKEGNLVGKLNYIGLGIYSTIQCPFCGLISYDPIPDENITKQGCALLYELGFAREKKRNLWRGFGRSYRRGGYFARQYLRRFLTLDKIDLLEVGPGDGYFSQGIAKSYPKSSIQYVDIVESLVQYYKEHFSCRALAGEFSSSLFPDKKFDLVIARDLLEHLRNPTEFLCEVRKVLKKNGLLFFITPNGKEDFWMINQRFIKTGDPTVAYLNHFHFFLPETLDKLIGDQQFSKKIAFKFGLKQHKKGLGHREFEKFPAQEAPQIKENVERINWKHNVKRIVSSPLHSQGILSRLLSYFEDREKEICDYSDPKGHEFFVLAESV